MPTIRNQHIDAARKAAAEGRVHEYIAENGWSPHQARPLFNAIGIDISQYDKAAREVFWEKRKAAADEVDAKIAAMKKAACANCQHGQAGGCDEGWKPQPHGSCEEFTRFRAWRKAAAESRSGKPQ